MKTADALRDIYGHETDGFTTRLAEIADDLVRAADEREDRRMAEAALRDALAGDAPLIDNLRRALLTAQHEDLSNSKLPAVTRADAYDVVKQASRENPSDRGLVQAKHTLYDLWSRDPIGIMTVGELSTYRDHFADLFPKSAAKSVFDRDIPEVGFQTLTNLPFLTRLASEVVDQESYEHIVELHGLDGDRPEQVRGRAYIAGLAEMALSDETFETPDYSITATMNKALSRLAQDFGAEDEEEDPADVDGALDMDDGYMSDPDESELPHDEHTEEMATITSPITGEDLVIELGVKDDQHADGFEPSEDDAEEESPMSIGGLPDMEAMSTTASRRARQQSTRRAQMSTMTLKPSPAPSPGESPMGGNSFPAQSSEAELGAGEPADETITTIIDPTSGEELQLTLTPIEDEGPEDLNPSDDAGDMQEEMMEPMSAMASAKSQPTDEDEDGMDAAFNPGVSKQPKDKVKGISPAVLTAKAGLSLTTTQIKSLCASQGLDAPSIETKVLSGDWAFGGQQLVAGVSEWGLGGLDVGDDLLLTRYNEKGDVSAIARRASLAEFDGVVNDFMALCAAGLAKSAQKETGAGGWPLVPSKMWPGEKSIACPKCGSLDVTMGGSYPVRGTGAGGRGRLGDAGGLDTNTCNDCGFSGSTPSKPIKAAAKRVPKTRDYVLTADVPQGAPIIARRMMASVHKIVANADGEMLNDGRLSIMLRQAEERTVNRIQKVLTDVFGIRNFEAQHIEMAKEAQRSYLDTSPGREPQFDDGINYDPESSGSFSPQEEEERLRDYCQHLGMAPEQIEREVHRMQSGLDPIDPRLRAEGSHEEACGPMGMQAAPSDSPFKGRAPENQQPAGQPAKPLNAPMQTSATGSQVQQDFIKRHTDPLKRAQLEESIDDEEILDDDMPMTDDELMPDEGDLGESLPPEMGADPMMGGPGMGMDPMGGGMGMGGPGMGGMGGPGLMGPPMDASQMPLDISSGQLMPEDEQAVGAAMSHFRNTGLLPLEAIDKFVAAYGAMLDKYGDATSPQRGMAEAAVVRVMSEAYQRPAVIPAAAKSASVNTPTIVKAKAKTAEMPTPKVNTQQKGKVKPKKDMPAGEMKKTPKPKSQVVPQGNPSEDTDLAKGDNATHSWSKTKPGAPQRGSQTVNTGERFPDTSLNQGSSNESGLTKKMDSLSKAAPSALRSTLKSGSKRDLFVDYDLDDGNFMLSKGSKKIARHVTLDAALADAERRQYGTDAKVYIAVGDGTYEQA